VIDGLRVIRPIHTNHRSHIHLVQGPDGALAAMKIPATDLRDDPDALHHFAMEDWIAQRIDSAHVLRAANAPTRRTKLYSLTEFIDGQTLRQWMHDTPNPPLEMVRGIVEQIIAGLRAFHRREMLHQDVRPENILIDADGSVRIIDFGAVRVAGVAEAVRTPRDDDVPGTVQYAAPEYFAGEAAGNSADLYSLGVITYEMLTGRLPYGTQVARIRSRRDRTRLRYISAREGDSAVPDWIDHALRRAVHPDPNRRYSALSEFAADLRRPAEGWTPAKQMPLVERNPVRFWQAVSLILALMVVVLLAQS
jgi:serine/threonine protein kinase